MPRDAHVRRPRHAGRSSGTVITVGTRRSNAASSSAASASGPAACAPAQPSARAAAGRSGAGRSTPTGAYAGLDHLVADLAVALVEEHDDRQRDAQRGGGSQLGQREHQAAVAAQRQHAAIRAGERRAHRGRHGVAERAEAGRVQERARPLGGQPAERAVVAAHRAVAGDDRFVVEHAVDRRQPREPRARLAAVLLVQGRAQGACIPRARAGPERGDERFQRRARVADHRHRSDVVGVRLARIDVDAHELARELERRPPEIGLAELRADREHHVAVLEPRARRGQVEPRAEREPVPVRDRALAVGRRDHRRAEPLGELAPVRPRRPRRRRRRSMPGRSAARSSSAAAAIAAAGAVAGPASGATGRSAPAASASRSSGTST